MCVINMWLFRRRCVVVVVVVVAVVIITGWHIKVMSSSKTLVLLYINIYSYIRRFSSNLRLYEFVIYAYLHTNIVGYICIEKYTCITAALCSVGDQRRTEEASKDFKDRPSILLQIRLYIDNRYVYIYSRDCIFERYALQYTYIQIDTRTHAHYREVCGYECVMIIFTNTNGYFRKVVSACI